MMSADTLARVRVVLLGLAGLICAAYCLLALAWDTPRPLPWWLPAAAGLSCAGAIAMSAFAAGRRNAEIAMDELYRYEWGRAVQISYWLGIAFFVIGALLVAQEWIGARTAVAAFGVADGGCPMLLYCFFYLRD